MKIGDKYEHYKGNIVQIFSIEGAKEESRDGATVIDYIEGHQVNRMGLCHVKKHEWIIIYKCNGNFFFRTIDDFFAVVVVESEDSIEQVEHEIVNRFVKVENE